MGFGFNLFFAFVVFPLLLLTSVVLLIGWLSTRRKQFGFFLAGIWLGFLDLFSVLLLTEFIFSKKKVDHEDVYGQYVIDRTRFSGKQADWQYDHYRFEITEQDSFLFHVTEEKRVIRTYRGKIENLHSGIFQVQVDTPRHHIIDSLPTLYRERFSHYYVFYSPKYGNVFFKKGTYRDTWFD